jgi:hypothetical protein
MVRLGRMAMRKVSITLEPEVLEAARRAAGKQGLSAFVNAAVRQKLQAARLSAYISEMETAHGPISEEAMERVRSEWPRH